ncbi:hypothetical protein DICVIV_12722 [Dictyocaulus viviparus]|uniref:Uncharacterized protein n=1 Tax=Dictyocaulus viviparus TaxID=29172 RepID=A0A0D8XG20_DICVI|nr:hypothetical protein DICVIV_12722 [Dictyocaulus viviparus]
MSKSPFIRSFYCSPVSKTVQPDLHSTEVPRKDVRHDQQNTAVIQYPINPPRVPEHYFAPKPFVLNKPLIESSYCWAYGVEEYHKIVKSSKCEDIQHGLPVNDRLDVPIVKCSDMGDGQGNVFREPYQPYKATSNCQSTTFHRNTNERRLIDEVEMSYNQKDTNEERHNQKSFETSEYAWLRLDKEREELYGIHRNYEPVAERSINYTQDHKIVPDIEDDDWNKNGLVNEKKNVAVSNVKPMTQEESDYLGFSNDLYPAYCLNKTTLYDTHTTSVDDTQNRSPRSTLCRGAEPETNAPDVVQPTSSSAFHNDTRSGADDYDTAVETPKYLSRFKTVIKPTIQKQHYRTQYSPIGNAFDPVGQMQLSEYHFEDLNDLVSCIGAH